MEVYNFKCKNCGSTKCQKIDDETYKCEYCGSEERIKKSDEKTVLIDTTFLKETAENFKNMDKNKKNSLIMLLICIFFGELGVHRFLQKKIFSGLLYLFTGGLLGVGWIIDICKYAVKYGELDGDNKKE